jgi:hypothetical protein
MTGCCRGVLRLAWRMGRVSGERQGASGRRDSWCRGHLPRDRLNYVTRTRLPFFGTYVLTIKGTARRGRAVIRGAGDGEAIFDGDRQRLPPVRRDGRRPQHYFESLTIRERRCRVLGRREGRPAAARGLSPSATAASEHARSSCIRRAWNAGSEGLPTSPTTSSSAATDRNRAARLELHRRRYPRTALNMSYFGGQGLRIRGTSFAVTN